MTYLIYITSCFVAGLLFIASPLVAVASQRIITGCKQGAVEKHVQEFPLQALGAVPNKILNWEVALARGSHKIRIASWHNFVPKIYTKSRNGGYRHAGINTATESRKSSNGRTFYMKEFSVTHNSDVWRNFWLL